MASTSYLQALLQQLSDPAEPSDSLREAYRRCHINPAVEPLQPLTSVLGQVGGQDIRHRFEPAPLVSIGQDAVFASQTQKELGNWAETTQASLRELQEKVPPTQRGYAYTLYHWLHTYAARVAPSDAPDTSLFDRNRVLAATTACLDKEPDAPLLVAKGGINGIQRYLYHRVQAEQMGDAVKVAKRLRGRSFLVSFLNQVIAEVIIERLGLPQANLLFTGGGHFTLLLPDTVAMREQLTETIKVINLGLLEHIGPRLSITVATSTWEKNGDFATAYRAVQDSMDQQKLRRYHGHLAETFQTISEDNRLGGGVEEEEEVGRLAPYARYVLEVHAQEGLVSGLRKSGADFSGLAFVNRFHFLFRNEKDLSDFLKEHTTALQQADGLKIIALNQPDIMHLVGAFSGHGLDIAYGFRFFGQYAPTYEGNATAYGLQKDQDDSVMLLEHLAATGSQNDPLGASYAQLAALRLDVDDLGAIFGHGLGADWKPERLLCLSREMQLFFGGYFNELAREHQLYVVYSGGDDAFVIGHWLDTIHFAELLELDFRSFTVGNPQINFSAGLFLCHSHYPIPRLAKEAGALEGEAKKYPIWEKKSEDKTKNALHIFNHTLSWPRFRDMMDKWRELQQVLPQEKRNPDRKVQRSLLRRFLRTVQTTQSEGGEMDVFARYQSIAALHYLAARQKHGHSQQRKRPEDLDKLGRIIQELLQMASDPSEKGQRRFQDLTVPLHIALYTTRNTAK